MKISKLLAMAATATVLVLGASDLLAQGAPGGRGGRGNFDPAQFQQRMMDRYKEAFGVSNDAEWQVIQTRIEKVMEARRAVGMGGGRAMFGRRGGQGNRGGGNNQEANTEADALQKAIDAKAPAEEIKAKLAAFRAARQQKEAALEKAQNELKQVLTVRQEAIAVTMGLAK